MTATHHASAFPSHGHHLVDKLLSRLHHRVARRHTGQAMPPQRKKILFESLEPRLLLSADLLPGAVQNAPSNQVPVDLQYAPGGQSPQINWSSQMGSGDTPLYANNLVAGFDVDNFSSPLVPVAPAGSTVYAGGVQGTLDVNGDSDSLSITLDAGQTFTLRLKAASELRASIEAFDPDNNSLGMLEASSGGGSLILQSRAADTSGVYRIDVSSLEGAGSYTVELFLNAAVEEGDGNSAGQAQDLDGVFSYLLDSDALRGSMIGEMSGQLPVRVLAGEDFQDFDTFWQRVNDGTWQLQTTGSSDAYVTRATQFGGEGSEDDSYLDMVDDNNYVYSEVFVDDGYGGTVIQSQYSYDESLNEATWRVDLTGVTRATLQFEQWGHDPLDNDGYGGGAGFGSESNLDTFVGDAFNGWANFDGVSVSTDGENWVVLQVFGSEYYTDRQQYSVDLIQAAAENGITLGANTWIRFQSYNPGGDFTYSRDYSYRNFDNIHITTDQQQLLLTSLGVVGSGTDYGNDISLLTDGVFPPESSDFGTDQTVWWFDQEVFESVEPSGELGSSAGALEGLYFDIDLGGLQRVSDLVLSVDNNDRYAVDYSVNGVDWLRLLTIEADYGNSDVPYGMDTFSTWDGSADYDANLDFDAVTAQFLRIYATDGDGAYAIGEVQAYTNATLDQEDWYSLSLSEGELASFTLAHEVLAGGGDLVLELYDQDQNLLTAGLVVGGQVNRSIENFRAPQAGTYYLRVAGNANGEYNLTAVKQALFGASDPGTKDLTLTPIMLDALSTGSGEIRVAVMSSGNVVAQLNDDTYFNFSATFVSYDQIDTLQELANFDAVVLGDYVDPYNVGQFAPALRQWVEAGHGLITTGWGLYYLSLQYGTPNTDLNAVIPVELNTYAGYSEYFPAITIEDSSHPVTQGLSDFSSSNYYDYVIYGQNGISAGATQLGSYSGSPAIVVGMPVAGRSVVLAPDYAGSSGWSTGMADRLLEQAVAWSALPTNRYTISALAGTDLVVNLDLVGGDAGEPGNTLQPVLELRNDAGQLLASGTTALNFAVLDDAQFTIVVRGAGEGDYLLRASGDLPALVQALTIESSSLDGIDTTTQFPGYVDLVFSEPVLYTSLQASDLSVNGQVADDFSILSPTQIRFWFNGAYAGDGTYQLILAAASVTDIHGNTHAQWQHDVVVDSHGPQVTGSSIASGEVLAPGSQTITLTFNEDLDTNQLGIGDLYLYESLNNQSHALSGLNYNAETRELSVTTAALSEGNYTLSLASGYYSVRDLVGNALDGNADGSNGDAYTLNFSVDVGTVAYPAMRALPPLGSMVYDPLIAGFMHVTGDIDSYTVSLDPGQLLTVVADVFDGGLQMQVAVVDVDDESVVAVLQGGLGEGVALQTLSGLSGDYRIDLTSLAGSGRYDFALVLNALVEVEMLAGGASNNSLGSAVTLAGSSLAVGNAADRLAIVGERAGSGGAIDDDYFRLELSEGQAASFALAWADGGSGELRLQLLAPDGTALVLATNDARNAEQVVRDFVAPAAGDYLLRVSGNQAGRYNLVATRGISLSLPSNLPDSPGQDISRTGQVLGALGGNLAGGSGLVAVVAAASNSSGLQAIVTQLNDHSFTNLSAVLVTTSQVDTLDEMLQYDAIVIGGTGYSSSQFNAFAQNLRPYVESGGGLVLTGWGIYASSGLSGQTRTDFDAIVPVNTSSYSYFNGGTLLPTGSHAIVDGVTSFSVPIYIEYPAYSPQVDGGATVLATLGSTPVAAAMQFGDGRSVYLGPIYSGSTDSYNTTSLRSGEADQLLEQAVAWTAGNRSRGFTVQADAGATLTITLSTPTDGSGEPVNNLVPVVELRDPDGVLVNLQANGAGSWTYETTLAGAYLMQVRATSGSGSFVLGVSGMAAADPQLAVTSASIAQDQVFSSAPMSVDIDFSSALRIDSIQAGDLKLNGQSAVGVIQVDGDTLRFDITGLILSEGLYTLEIQAAALDGANGASNSTFDRSFFVDATAPTVTASSVVEGEVLVPGLRTIVFTFSEDLDSSGLGAEDVLLTNSASGQSHSPTSFVYDATTDQLTVQYANLIEGAYTLTLRSAANGLRDLVGNALNGDTSTLQPDDHVLHFIVDAPTGALPALTAMSPTGSLIYKAELPDRAVHAIGDTDAFTVELDAGQTLTLWASPTAGSARLAIELFDATTGGNSLGLIEASQLGQTVLLQTLAIDGGSYRVEVRSLEGMGKYTLKVLLNAALESEQLPGGAINDVLAQAQDLTATFITTGSDRAAVVGQNSTGGNDWYRLHLDAGQLASFVLTAESGAIAPDLWLGLYDASGMLLTAGSDIGTNVSESIIDFSAVSGGDHYLRVMGDSVGQYSLVATRGQSFSIEQTGTVQDISLSGEVLGALGGSGGSGTIRVAVLNSGAAGQVVNQLNDDSYFNFTATSVTTVQIDTMAELANYDVVMLGDSNTSHNQIQAIAPVLRQWVEAGGGIVGTGWLIYSVGTANGAAIADIDAIVPVNTSIYYQNQYNPLIDITQAIHPVTVGVSDFYSNTNVEFSTDVDPGAQVLAMAGSQAAVVVGNAGAGRGVYLGPLYMVAGSTSLATGDADRLLEQAVAWAAGDAEDKYQVRVQAGDALTITTTTPGDGAGEPANSLNLRVELLDETGQLVASDDDSAADGRNVRLNHQALTGGTYTLRVVRQDNSGSGAYVLRVEGATGAGNPAPQVIASSPIEGKRLNTAPTSVTLDLSESLLASSLGVDDLIVDGGLVTGVEMVDGDTVRFQVAMPTTEGTFQYHLQAGGLLDLQGVGNLAYSGGFIIDTTSPRVVSQDPPVQSISPFSTWSVTFNEALDPATVQTNDFILRNPGNGNIVINSATLSEDRLTVTLQFSGQSNNGNYSLTVGTNILDAAGNRMDQDSVTSGFQAYTGTVQVAAPDLTPTAIVVTRVDGSAITEAGAALGGQVKVTWTVQNIGNDAARASYWYDSLWLSTDTNPASDISLGSFVVDVDPGNTTGLQAGGTYTMSANVTLPLNDSMNAGNFFIRVQVDQYTYYNYNSQPESNENNNARYSEAFATVIPSLPDLTVSEVTAPAAIEVNKNTTISWTVQNQGPANADGSGGYWHDRIVLSSDQVFGNGDDVYLNEIYYYDDIPAGGSLARSATVNIGAAHTGAWYVLVKTDQYNSVYERTNEGNNVGVSAQQVQVIVPTEDLKPTELIAPAAAVFGDAISVSWTVENIGSGPTYGDWQDRLWLSRDAVRSGDDISLTGVQSNSSPDVSPLASGAQYTRSIQNVRLPLTVNLADGTYYLLLETDANAQEPESNEANNVISRQIALTLADYPDLTVDTIVVPAGAVASGQPLSVQFTLHNQGDAAAQDFNNQLWLSSDGVALDIHVGDYFFNQSLAVGASISVSQSITVPLYQPGNWRLIVLADNGNQVYEHAHEGNNRGVSAGTIQSVLPPLPDLVVSNIVAPVEALSGDTITVSWTITNQGTGDFSGIWHDRVYLSGTGGGSVNQDFGNFAFEGLLAAGASITRTQNLTLNPTQEGTLQFVVVTDAYNQVNETPAGQNNNFALDDSTLAITFPPLPNLQVTGLVPPSDPASGTSTVISWTVTNNGIGATSSANWYDQIHLSLNDIWGDGDDIDLGAVINPIYLQAGESYQNSRTISFANGLSGDYFFLVRTDIYNHVFEDQNEGDNILASPQTYIALTPPPDLKVDMVEAPTTAFSGQTAIVTWTVRNHGTGGTVGSSWYDRVVMSEDDVLGNADDRNMGDRLHTGSLDADGSYDASKLITLPIGVIGNFHMFVITDVNNHIYEHGSEFNNTGTDILADETGPETMEILLTPPPDLEVLSVAKLSNPEAGRSYTANWRVANFGSTSTPNNSWTDRVYLSADGILDASDTLLADRLHYGVLSVYEEDSNGNAIGGFYDSSVGITLPFDISGSYRLIVKTDIGNQVFEGFAASGGEDNNTWASAAMTVASNPADLLVSSISTSPTGEAGKQITVSWTVKNNGVGDSIASSWFDQIRLSADDILFDDDDVVLQNYSHAGVLAANGSYSRTETVTVPFSVTGGNYRVYVLTDAGGYVHESDDANNTASASIDIQRETPDLVLTSLAHEAGGMAALQLDVSWRVENQGNNQTNSNNWYDEVYLSLDQALDGSDIYLGARYRNAGLVVAAGYDASASFTVPANIAPNDYHVILRTDRDNVVTEGPLGEANNVRVSTDTVHVVAFDINNPDGVVPLGLLRPDLAVTLVDAPDTAVSGQFITVSWTVVNNGPDPTGNRSWYDAIYMSRDGVLDRSADSYLGYAYHSNLAAGDSYTETLNVQIPYGQSGPFYIFVGADSGRYIGETNEFNNVGQDPAFTQVSLAPPADLVVGSITVPANGIPGQNATISFSVNNQGSNPALGSWNDSVYISADGTWDINDPLFGVVTHHGDVAGGASYSNTITAAMPGLTPGDYKVIVRSDIRNYIPESNENNNIGGSLDAFALDVEALVLGTPTIGNLANGQAVYYKFDVAAGETIRLQFDSAGQNIANELYLRYGAMPTRGQFDIAAREGFVADPELVVPTTQAGTYYVLAYGQSVAGNPAYSIQANIIPFSITSVSADEIGNMGDVTLRIEGAKFSSQTRFGLVAPDGQTVIEAQSVYLESTSEAYVTFGMFGAALGAYDLVATQPDGASTSKLDAVTVEQGSEAAVFMSIAGPTQVMVNRSNVFTLDYVNDGGTDAAAPLMIVESRSATPVGLSASDMRVTPLQIMAASFDGPMDILRPGARYSIPLVFQSSAVAGPLDIRVGRILADDTRLITDWNAIEASIRPSSIGNSDWATFWGRIKPLIGLTWGEYVQVLDLMMKEVSEPGHPVRDVREIFARMFQENPNYVPYAGMSGQVRDSESDTGLADVQMAAYLVRPDGSLQYKASALSDADGHYSFARLNPGDYKIVAIGRALDMDRDGQVDLTVPQFTLGYNAPGDAGIIYIQPLGGIGSNNDSSAALDRDANGITHMVWSRDGLVWHAWFDTSTGQWKDAQALAEGDSYGPAIASGDKLFDSATAGTIVAWQQGKGNDAEIWYAVARAKVGGGFEWSTPQQLTNDNTMDAAVQIVVGDNGLVMITHLKSNGEIQDDTDIYYDIFALSQSDFLWPAAVSAADSATSSDAALDSEGVSVAYGRQWKFGPWDFFGTEAEISLALSGSIGENNCVATLGAQGQISGSFKGSSIRSTITGNGSASAEWTVNQASKDWLFSGAKAGWGASAQFDWRYGLSTLLSKIPHPAVTAAYAAYRGAVATAGFFGLDFEDGITFGGGASFSNMSWTLTQPFPDFVWPESIAEASISGNLGVYAQLDVTGGDSVRLQGDITVTVDIAPEVKLKSISGNITLSGNIGWFTFNEVFSIDFYSASGLEMLGTPMLTQDASGPVFNAQALFGTALAYGDNHMLADVSGDLFADSAMSLANDAGTLFGAYTHMTNPTIAIGSDVMVAEYSGTSWAPPVVLSGSMGLNSDATAAVDGLGQRMVIWTHADGTGLGMDPTIEDYQAALGGNEVVFAMFDESTGTWGAMNNVAMTTGMDSALAVSEDGNGNLLISWLARGSDDLNHLMTASWNGSAWSTPVEIAFGASVMDPAMERLGDGMVVVWTQDASLNPDHSEKALFYSTFNGTAWSAGAAFDPIAMATGLALSAGVPVSSIADTSLSTEGLFPPFPVPEECLKCKPEDIKRIRESAPECRDGGGTQVTFDEKTCTEKTIVYKPCAVRPRDPNDIIGPGGYGDEGWVAVSSNLGYMIRFENAADASAPAQKVVITQQLDADLDWRTFRIDDFGFGEQIVEVDGKSAFYQARLDYTADATRGYFLDVFASVNIDTGIVTWTITTIDPATGEVPQDASIGFLPVNDTVYDANHDVVVQGTGKGEGFVTYTVKAKRLAETGTVVDAQALIVFDTEEPIETPAIANMLDADDPSSQVISFATETTEDSEFLVSWQGDDGDDGSGIRDYTIFVSVDGGEFSIWQVNTVLTEAIYLGASGHSYSFYSTARDNAGNEDAQPETGDATIAVVGGVGAIGGTKFEDFDGDGVRDGGELGLQGWTLYLDSNNNSTLDQGERSTETAADGSYSFIDLAPGEYRVREVLQAGWAQTLAGNGGSAVNVGADQTVSGVDFGNFALAQIGGQKFNDVNANGVRDDGEDGLASWVITLDTGADGSIDATTTTDDYGYYRFTNLGPASYRIGEVLQSGWLQTSPAGGTHTVRPTSGEDVGDQDFGNVMAAAISGVKFEDIDGDGQRDDGEGGLVGWTIFLDTNGNGSLDSGEHFSVTDSAGHYGFDGLLPGDYNVAEVMQGGWMQTTPGTQPGSVASTSLTLSGMDVVLSLPEDVSIDEQALSTLALSANDMADTLVGLDALRADPRFSGLDGAGMTTVIIDTGIDLNHSWFGPDLDHNGIADRIVFSWDFADNDADASDRNGHGSHVASLVGGNNASNGGVAPGADLIALKVFSDDGHGYFSYLEQALQWVVANADSYGVGVVNLSLGDSGNWNDAIGRYGLGDELAALASHNILVTAASGNNFFQFGSNMGVAYPAADPAVLAVGAVWSGSFGGPVNYANGAADYNTGTDHLAAFGQRDDTLLDVLAPGTRMVGANYNGGTRTMFGTSQASAYMAGVATLAQELAMDHLGRRLNLTEFTTLLQETAVWVMDGDDESDNVTNTGLQFARVNVLSMAEGILALQGGGSTGGGGGTSDDGETLALAAPGIHQVRLVAGESRGDIDFGNFALGSIAGTVFHDVDTNQMQAGSEDGLAGWSVFLDGNANGALDLGEHSSSTDATGHFLFDAIGPGSYRVTLLGQDGWSVTTDSFFDVFMTSGLDTVDGFGVNAYPTLDALGPVSVQEGDSLSFLSSGHDDLGDMLLYSLTGDTHGAVVDVDTGVFEWTALDGDANWDFTLRVTDSAGASADQSFTVTVTNVAPTLLLDAVASLAVGQDYLLQLSATDPGMDTVQQWLVHWGDGSSSALDAASGQLGHQYALAGDYQVLVQATDEDGSYDTSKAVAVTETQSTLQVTAMHGTNTGFQVSFNQAIMPELINLYDSAFFNRGPADLRLLDAQGQAVAGSVVLDADMMGLRFVKTNGLLANGSYTVTLDSRDNAFVGSLGGLLDGNSDGVAGDSYMDTFIVNAGGAVLQIGEFSRGPGQAVDLPTISAGVPIQISGAAGATQVSFTLGYDASLLHITRVAGGANLPSGSSVSADFGTPGQVRITVALGSALGAGTLDLVRLIADVPATAPYGAKQVLDLRDIALDTGASVRDDDGLHLVAYVGDASGNAKYSTLDVQRIQRNVVRLDGGLGAYPLIDPVVVADINGNGKLTALDAQRILSEVMRVDRAEIPPIPKGMTLTFSGPDPVVKVGDVVAHPGETVIVPVTLDSAEGLESVEMTLIYPAQGLELIAVRLGGLTQDFEYFVTDTSVAGRVTIDMARLQAMSGGAGNLLELEFRVAENAQGALAIDLQSTALNETWLTLNVESQPGVDATDGSVQVQRPPTAVFAPAPVAVAAAPVVYTSAQAAPASVVAEVVAVPTVPTATTVISAANLPAVTPEIADVDFTALRAAVAALGGDAAGLVGTSGAAAGNPLPVIRLDKPSSAPAVERLTQDNWVGNWLSNKADNSAERKVNNNWKINLEASRPLSRL